MVIVLISTLVHTLLVNEFIIDKWDIRGKKPSNAFLGFRLEIEEEEGDPSNSLSH